VLERGAQSSSASYSSSWPSSKLSFLNTTKSKLIVRFVEDRSYKLLIVDSIMNLFRESASESELLHQLICRTRLLWSRRIIRATTSKRIPRERCELISRNSINSSLDSRSYRRSSISLSSSLIKYRRIQG
jgi:hypothetical protein